MRHPIRNVFIFIIFIIVIISGFTLYRVKETFDKINQNAVNIKKLDGTDASDLIKQGKSISILLLGTDTGALDRNYRGRTDTMMVLTLNKEKKSSSLVSIERDIPIIINGSYQKLNAAYTFDGVQSTSKEIEDLFNIKINDYALVNMGGLKKVVDAMGGVEVIPPITYTYEGYSFTKGEKTTVSGAKLLSFVRMRYDDPEGDYGRQKRQQLVIEAVVQKALTNPKMLLNDKFFNIISSNIQSDISFSDVMGIATKYLGALHNLKSDRTIGYEQYIGDASYQFLTDDEINRIHKVITGD
jgi:LCP family protein required for cell wall assembly